MTNYAPSTESMTRLLIEDKSSPSGWRVVGYEYHTNGWGGYKYEQSLIRVAHIQDIEESPSVITWLTSKNYIDHTAFEQGILMPDGEWWFAGDVNESEQILCYGEFSYEHSFQTVHCYGFYWKQKSGGVCQFYHGDTIKRIGSVHDKEE